MQQLRACGVLETIRISAAGFPSRCVCCFLDCFHLQLFFLRELIIVWTDTISVLWNRWTYQEFFSRYRVLMKQRDVLGDRKQTCKNVLEKLILVLDVVLKAFGIWRNKDRSPHSVLSAFVIPQQPLALPPSFRRSSIFPYITCPMTSTQPSCTQTDGIS